MNILKKATKYFYGGDWMVLYRKKNTKDFITLKGQKNYWYADPFLFEYNEDIYLFTEAFDTKMQIGKIAVSKLENGIFSIPKIIIENEYHMSYPCIFKNNDNIYMIPETGEGKKLEIYEFTEFPYKMTCTTLMEGEKLADSTVHFVGEDPFIISYNEEENSSKIYSLDISKSELTRVYEKKHEGRRFRPAGNLFKYEKNLYRPTQNCEESYGGSLIFNKVSDFITLEETLEKEIFPKDISSKYSKVHTYNSTEKYEVIDVFQKNIGISCLIGNVKRKVHRMKMRK